MKQDVDFYTTDLFGHKVLGRPRKSSRLSGKQRQVRYRQAELDRSQDRADRFAHLSDISIARIMADDGQDCVLRRELWLEFGRRLGWK